MIPNSSAARSFRLQAPKYYFHDASTQALLAAAMSGDSIKAMRLVAEGANPNDEGPLENDYNRLRPLHYALAANSPEAVKILIAVGADPQLSVIGYGEAFLFVMTLENINLMSLLLDLRPIDKFYGDTLKVMMFEAVTQPCKACLDLLLTRGAPIDLRDGAGYTVFMAAMDTQDYDLAEWLLSRGASVEVETGAGVTPAYSVEFHLNKFKPGSPTYKKVLHLKEMMQERGAVFPALTPEEVRARREKTKTNPTPR